jgi:hypothetical protein
MNSLLLNEMISSAVLLQRVSAQAVWMKWFQPLATGAFVASFHSS